MKSINYDGQMDYKYIRAWGQRLNSFPGYIENEVEKARRDHAPQTAIYQCQDGSWATFEEIESENSRNTIAMIIEKMQQEAQQENEKNAR